ncbi:MAG: gliding motility-associated C-terminal domain-containing protein [Patescibacteria group bacterium]
MKTKIMALFVVLMLGFAFTQKTKAQQIVILQDISCNGGSNGHLVVFPDFGTPPYTYLWNTGAITPDINNLVAGFYDVTVTDVLLVTSVYSQNLFDPAPIVITLVSQTDVLCFGQATGAIDISVAGGTGGFLFDWSNGQLTEDVSNLFADNYDVLAIDANGCTCYANFVITEPATAVQVSISTTDVNCFGWGDGTATANVVGGTPPYTYLWSTGEITPAIINLNAGPYSVTVTDANGCIDVASVIVKQPLMPLLASVFSIDVSCEGGNAGAAVVSSVFGGTPPYTYLWSTGAITPDISNLTIGIYTVTVSDANLCDFFTSVTINEPSLLTVALTSQTNVLCNGTWTGDVGVTTNGGTLPYAYLWNRDGFLFANTEDLTNIPAGNYDLFVTDANGCMATLNIIVTEPATAVQVSISTTDVNCFGWGDGTATANVVGGTSPYTYLWSTGAITPAIINLNAGPYSVTVTDANGCIAINSTIIVQPNFPIQITTTQIDVLCFGASTGMIDITDVTGANGPLAYLWSGGETTPSISNLIAGIYSVVITDATGCTGNASVVITEPTTLNIIPIAITPSACDGIENGGIVINPTGGTAPYIFYWREINTDSVYFTQNISGIRGGNYELTLTDNNGCEFTDTIFVPNTFTIPTNITPTLYVCNGLTGSVSINSPLADSAYYFTYSWNSTYNTGSFVTGDTLPTWTTSTSFVAGTYMITVTDNQTGCATYYAGIINQSATPLVVNHTQQNNACYEDNSGVINLYVTGGDPLPNYDVIWTGPNGFTSTAFSIFGLEVGNYTYTVTDDSACTVSGTIQIGPLLPLQGYATSTNVLCNGGTTGTAEVNYSGGTGPLNYLWSTGATTPVVSGLIAGNYSVTITDSVGCSATESVIVTQPGGIIVILDSSNNISCNGYSDGNIFLTTSGGTGTLSYSWLHNGNLTPFVTEDLNNIPAGFWEIIVTDANGCQAGMTFILTEPTATMFTDSVHYISCNNGNDGYWEITAVGIYSPYVVIFSTGDTISNDTANLSLSGLSSGSYSAIIYANNGCNWFFVLTLDQPLPMTVSLANITDIVCKGESTGSILLDNVHGGTPPYTYLWSNWMTTNPIMGISAGTYNVTISDSFNCTIEETHEVSEPYNYMKFFPTISTTTCQQAEDGQIMLEEWNIDDSPYLNWFLLYDSVGTLIDSVNTGEIIGNLKPGNYIGTVINSAGCWVTDSSIYIGKGEPDCILIPNLVTPNGDGFNDVFRVEGGCNYDEFLVELFTDQGEKVFESSECDFVWDPETRNALPNTVYFYFIEVTENGKSYQFQSSLNINY